MVHKSNQAILCIFGIKPEADGVNAVTFPGVRRAVGKDVSEMRVATSTEDLGAIHTVRIVFFKTHGARHGIIKTRPACAGIKFGGRAKERIAARNAVKRTPPLFLQKFPGKRRLGSLFPQDCVLLGREFLAEFFFGLRHARIVHNQDNTIFKSAMRTMRP